MEWRDGREITRRFISDSMTHRADESCEHYCASVEASHY